MSTTPNVQAQDPNETAYNCGKCYRPDEDESQMVFCDNCQRWFHFSCEGVTAEVQDDHEWVCTKCSASRADDVPANSRDLEGADKAFARERQVLLAQLEKRKESAKAKLKLEQWKREMMWEIEKQELEDMARAEEEFLRKKKVEKEKILRRIEAARSESARLGGGVEVKKKKKPSAMSFDVVKPNASTPKTKKSVLSPVIAKQSEVERDPVREKKVVRSQSVSNCDSDSDSSVNECLKDKSDCGSASDSEGGSSVDECCSNTSKRRSTAGSKEIVPTKAQLSARQFLGRRLPTFSGKPEEWAIFIASYETTTKACGFSNLENLARLQECLRGAALEAVGSRLLLPQFVPKIMQELREQFGQPEQILDTLLVKVRSAEAPKSEKPASYIVFGRLVQQLCDHMEATHLEEHLVNPLLIGELAKKLPATSKMDWIRYKRTEQAAEKRITLRTFADFLTEIVSVATEAVNLVDGQASSSRAIKPQRNRSKEHGYVNAHREEEEKSSQENKRTPCVMCGATNHRLRNCDEFLKLDPAQRLKAVGDWGLCRSCLNPHGKSRCKIFIRCKVANCEESHNTLLHQPHVRSSCNVHSSAAVSSVLFRMIPIVVRNGSKTMKILAFLDEGSSYTLVESSVAEALECRGVVQPLRVTWTAGLSRVERESRRIDLMVSGLRSQEFAEMISVHTVKELKLPHQGMQLAEVVSKYQHLDGLPVEDYPSEAPRILIGLKHLHLFAPLESRVGKPGEPIAVRSKLGWTVYGPQENYRSHTTFVGHHRCTSVSNEELYNLLKSHYVLEDSAVMVDLIPESEEDCRAREILERTTVRIGDRFQSGLLWKEDDPRFPNSYAMAEKRMRSLERRLQKNAELKENVQKQIVEYVQKGYCHRATQHELRSTDPQKVWYLPLNIVLNPKKPGKVRLVWDAAASVQGVSLNSKLLKGPDFLTSLPAVICQFRERRIGFGGDIREMFHQVRIRPEDRQAQRFLFGGDAYVMDCAIFGATCSPSQALYVKDRNAKDFAAVYPEAADAVVKKHYVDDYFDSADSVEEAVKRASEVREIHAHGGFEIRNWVSNASEVLQRLGEWKDEDQDIHFHRDKESEYERVLGIVWSSKRDVFTFSTQVKEQLQPYLFAGKRPTKRIVLSCVMSFFDPLGLLATFTVHGRTLVQDLWRTGCDWDEGVDDEAMEKWARWTSCLADVEAVEIPRYYFGDGAALDYESLQLHVFVDASENAYGCVGYFRIMTEGVPRCALVQARSKVAPIKPHSIPRLELMAAVLGARLKDKILESHNFSIKKVCFWTDSRTVRSWILSDARKYRQFVAFRIGEILSRTKAAEWRWIPTKLNVADQLTKWSKGPFLSADSAWFRGPQFLYQPESEWPIGESADPNVAEELRAACLYHTVEVHQRLIDVSRVSKWSVLVRTVACVLRFIANIRRKQKRQPIEVLPALPKFNYRATVDVVRQPLRREEFQRAEQLLWRQAQGEAFGDEVCTLHRLRDGKSVAKLKIERSSPLYKLSPILDDSNVVRVEGRTAQAEFLPFEMRFPVVLPRGHPITERVIEQCHRDFGHGHREAVVSELMQRFCIPKIRVEVKKVMQSCVWCKVYKCKPTVPRMAPLPVQRVTPYQRPFSFTGVDYFGPITATVGRRTEKRWVALFTCLTTRAIHLELVRSLSTQACLMAIRRFACRRGMPVEFFSDNGTNFVGASKEVVKRIELECSEAFTSARTRWNFNPPAAPHMGGAWERLVRSVKEALKESDDGRSLSDEVLETVLAEAEEMVNSRPLTFVSQENAEPEALTPNHFIRGYPSSGVEVVHQPTNEAEALRDQYRRSQLLADRLWKRWVKEYLPTLNLRTKWHEEKNAVQVGDLVYMADDANRKSWMRGVVDETIRGADGRIRQVVVRAGGKQYRRAVAKIAVPEISGCKTG